METTGLIESIIFWAADSSANSQDVEIDETNALVTHTKEESVQTKQWEGQSMYVTMFEDMLNIVLKDESHLFTQEEIHCFERYNQLSYEARYILIRLCLRKVDQWFKLQDLKRYQYELGDKLLPAVRELCASTPANASACNVTSSMVSSSSAAVFIKEEEQEIFDLAIDDEPAQPIVGSSSIAMPPSTPGSLFENLDTDPDYTVFCKDETHASLQDLLESLDVAELKDILKTVRLRTKKPLNTRDAIIDALLTSTSTQTTLQFFPISKEKTDPSTRSSWSQKGKLKTQRDVVHDVVLKRIEACIKLNDAIVALFNRINLVYYRSTSFSQKLMTHAILNRAQKRFFAAYEFTRTSHIWLNREALLQYEEALKIEAEVDALLGSGFGGLEGGSGTRGKSRSRSKSVKRTSGPRGRSTLSPDKKRRTTVSVAKSSDAQMDMEGNAAVKESPRLAGARAVKMIFEEIYPKWQTLVEEAEKIEGKARTGGLERFDCGYVLTRVICKCAHALSLLHEHQAELAVLNALLAQKRWRRGRRGRWYERRALILMTHMGDDEDVWKTALGAVSEALRDDDVHIVYRPKLLRRLIKLCKRLKFPPPICDGRLEKAEEVWIEGKRLRLMVDETGRLVNGRAASVVGAISTGSSKAGVNGNIKQMLSPKTETKSVKIEVISPKMGKSVWEGKDGEELTVEMFALQHYEKFGYQGHHCEGRLLTTLFGLLFFDIIFASIPGALETPYQAAPLDIVDDTFYTSRQHLASVRLNEIKKGGAAERVACVWDEHCKMKTRCVGVHWDTFSKEDLVVVAEYLPGPALAAICQTLCEDYGGRTSGLPDLTIWNKDKKICRFVEVKGPGDTPQENQKVWIDVLLQAGVHVEVCHVAELGASAASETKQKKVNTANKKAKPHSGVSTTTPKKKRKRETAEVDSKGTPCRPGDELDHSQLDVKADMTVKIESTAQEQYIKLEDTDTKSESEEGVPTGLPSPRKVRHVMEVVITSPRKRPRLI